MKAVIIFVILILATMLVVMANPDFTSIQITTYGSMNGSYYVSEPNLDISMNVQEGYRMGFIFKTNQTDDGSYRFRINGSSSPIINNSQFIETYAHESSDEIEIRYIWDAPFVTMDTLYTLNFTIYDDNSSDSVYANFTVLDALGLTKFQNESYDKFNNVSFKWLNPYGDKFNHTYIHIPAGMCVYDSQFTINGSNVTGANDSEFQVVLVTDLSNSMDDCIKDVYINESIPIENCYSFGDKVHEGDHDIKWNEWAGDWNVANTTILGSSVPIYRQNSQSGSAYTTETYNLPFTNFTAEFKVLLMEAADSGDYFQFNFGRVLRNQYNYHLHHGAYTIRLRGDGRILLYQKDYPVDSVMTTINLTEFHKFRITAKNVTVLVYIDGNLTFNYTDLNRPMVRGYISLSTFDSRVFFDNIYIKSLDHNYTATRSAGYATYVKEDSYLYDNIGLMTNEDGACQHETLDTSIKSCVGLPFCNEHCSNWVNEINNRTCAEQPTNHMFCTESTPTYNEYLCSGPEDVNGVPVIDPCCQYTRETYGPADGQLSNALLDPAVADPLSCCYNGTDCTYNTYAMYYPYSVGMQWFERGFPNCSVDNFTDFNLYRCHADRNYYYCSEYDILREGTCNENNFSQGGSMCVDMNCYNVTHITDSYGDHRCRDGYYSYTMLGQDYDIMEDGFNSEYALNFSFDGGTTQGWGSHWTVTLTPIAGALQITDTNGGYGYASIPSGRLQTLYINNLSFDYNCDPGFRFGLRFSFGDGVGDTACIQGTGRINCGDLEDRIYAAGSFDTPIICDNTWHRAHVNLTALLGDRVIYNLYIIDEFDNNVSNAGLSMRIDNFVIGRNYTVPGGYFAEECGAVPDITNEGDEGSRLLVCDVGSCNNLSARCYMTPTKTTEPCNESGYNNTNLSICKCFGAEASSCRVWNRLLQKEARYDDIYQDCSEPRYYWEGYSIINHSFQARYCNESDVYVTYCDDISGEFSVRNNWVTEDFDDSNWAELMDYINEGVRYYRSLDGSCYNSWNCDDCSRFYRKKFPLEKNIAIFKPLLASSCTLSSEINHDLDVYDTYYNVNCGSGNDSIDIDLTQNYNISRIKVWMYYSFTDPMFYRFEIQVSNNSDFSDSRTLWDYSVDGLTKSTSEGFELVLNKTQDARYVRINSSGYVNLNGIYVNNYNMFVQAEVFTPITTDEITDTDFFINRGDSAVCYLNNNSIYFNDDDQGRGGCWGWSTNRAIPFNFFKNGTNTLACQVKTSTGSHAGFNSELRVNVNTTLIHRSANYKFVQQDDLCSAEEYHNNAPNNRFDPDANTCEYGTWVESCNMTYPFNVSRLNWTIAAWTFRNDYNSFTGGFVPVVEYFADMVGANITYLNYSHNSNFDPQDLPAGFWNANIIFFDDDNHISQAGFNTGWFRNRIKHIAGNGTNIITTPQMADHMLGFPSMFNASPFYTAQTYDHKANSTDFTHGTGHVPVKLIADQETQLAYYWSYNNHLHDDRDKAANLLTVLFPVWSYGTSAALPIHTEEYCIEGGGYCEICDAEKIKLATDNDNLFIDMTAGTGNPGMQVSLVSFGNTADGCYNTINFTNRSARLYNEISNYGPNCGATCLPCALNSSINQYLESSFALTDSATNNIVLMSDGLSNTLTNGTVSVNLSKKQAWNLACNDSWQYSAASIGITIHAIYYGGNDSQESIDAIHLMANLSDCTGGIFVRGDDEDSIREAYELIIGALRQGYPRPAIKFGNDTNVYEYYSGNSTYDWKYDSVDRLIGPAKWHNYDDGHPNAVSRNLMTAVNEEVLRCFEDNDTLYMTEGCNITLNITSNVSGYVTLMDMYMELVASSSDPQVYPYALPPEAQAFICPMDFGTCGNGILESGEECDPTENIILTCNESIACIPPGFPGACTCSVRECGDGKVNVSAGEECDLDNSTYPNTWPADCYPPGSAFECLTIPSYVHCGNGQIDYGEECEPNNATMCDPYACISPGAVDACTCVKPTYQPFQTHGTLSMDVTVGVTKSLDLRHYVIAPYNNPPQENFNWSINHSTGNDHHAIVDDPNPATTRNGKVEFNMISYGGLGKELEVTGLSGNGTVTVQIYATDPATGNFGFFNLVVNIIPREYYPVLDVTTPLLISTDKEICNYYYDKTTGKFNEYCPPYKATVWVWEEP